VGQVDHRIFNSDYCTSGSGDVEMDLGGGDCRKVLFSIGVFYHFALLRDLGGLRHFLRQASEP
jgi:hypothetical protein